MGIGSRDAARRTLGAAAVAAALLVATGCGSSDDSSSTTAKSGGAATNAAAAAIVKEFSAIPTGIGVDVPLSKAPPKGKNITFLQCSTPVCKGFLEGLQAAAKPLGWNIKSRSFTQTPEGIQSAVGAAVKEKPDGLFYAGIDDDLIKAQLAEAKSLGVPIVNANIPDEPGGPVISIIHGQRDSEVGAAKPADWIAANGGGKTLTVNVPTYPVLVFGTKAFTAELKKQCSDCDVEAMNQQVTDIGTKLPAAVVSRLQRDPKIKNVAFAFGDMATGVYPALKAAGLADKVRIVQYGSSGPTNFADVRDGRMAASSAWSIPYTSWRAMDAFARHFVGDDPSISTTADMPEMLLTKANSTLQSPAEGSYEFAGPKDYGTQFTKLWKIGG